MLLFKTIKADSVMLIVAIYTVGKWFRLNMVIRIPLSVTFFKSSINLYSVYFNLPDTFKKSNKTPNPNNVSGRVYIAR